MDKGHGEATLALVVPIVLLLAAVFGHWPYGLYTLMRLTVCGCAIYLAVKAKGGGRVAWAWIFGGMAVLFNPIVPMRMHRSDWRIVDLLAAFAFLAFAVIYKPRSRS